MNLLRQTTVALLVALALPAAARCANMEGTADDNSVRKHGMLAVDRPHLEIYRGDKSAFLTVKADRDFTFTTADAETGNPLVRVTRVNHELLRLDVCDPEATKNASTHLILRSADGRELRVPVRRLSSVSAADHDYMVRKAPSITVTWDEPFSYESIRSISTHKGPYLGNGDVGVLAHTDYETQTLKISKVDFVSDGFRDWAGDGATALPVGGVKFTVEDARKPSSFSYTMDEANAQLRMTSGTARPVQMTSWLSRGSNWLVTELATTSETPVKVRVETYADSAYEAYKGLANLYGDVMQATRLTKQVDVSWKSRAAITSRVLGTDVLAAAKTTSMASNEFEVTNAAPVYVVTIVSGGGKTNNPQAKWARDEVNAMTVERLDSLRLDLADWWADMWARSYVETGDEVLDRQYLASIYQMASALDANSPACPGMFGVWNMEDEMMHHGDIHLNYNTQSVFYNVYSSNRPELANSFYTFVEKMIPEGRRRAKSDMGKVHPSLQGKQCRGILFPVSAMGIGAFFGDYWNQSINAPFNVPLFNFGYEYTMDMDFLRDHTYPYLREIGDFYEDYIWKEPYGDSYRYCIRTGCHEGSWDLNPSSDVCFVELTFRLLVKYSKLLGVDADRRDLWNDILGHLPTYQVMMPQHQPNQGKPVISKNESEAGWDFPNHAINLHCIYPTEVLNRYSPADNVEYGRNTVYYYEADQNGFTECAHELGMNAFGMAARMGGFDPDMLLSKLRIWADRAMKNLVVWEGMEKIAIIESVNSMMMESTNGILLFYPCWPEGRKASFTRLRTKGAFLVSAAYDGSEVQPIELLSEKGCPCTFTNPWPGQDVTVTAGGVAQPLTQDGDRFTFATTAGTTYTISKR